jgi:hypothetical protein
LEPHTNSRFGAETLAVVGYTDHQPSIRSGCLHGAAQPAAVTNGVGECLGSDPVGGHFDGGRQLGEIVGDRHLDDRPLALGDRHLTERFCQSQLGYRGWAEPIDDPAHLADGFLEPVS